MGVSPDQTHQSVTDVRLAKRAALLEAGLDPYPVSPAEVEPLSSVRARHAELGPDSLTTDVVTVGGRIMFFRSSGKIAFASLQDGDGTRIQLMLTAQDLGAVALGQDAEPDLIVSEGKARIRAFAHEVDLGDIVSVTGPVCTSIKGELSVRVHAWTMGAKSIRPLPFLHADLSGQTRVRQPYLELIQSQEARQRVLARSLVIREVRRAFEDWSFLEVETPILQAQHGGAQARPFRTHVNAMDQDWSLRIAMELPLKKLVVGGVDRVFELGKVFRNEGSDSSHSPEFTMLEAYAAWSDMYGMAELTEALFRRVCSRVAGDEISPYRLELPDSTVIDFSEPWRWVSVYSGVSDAVGFTVTPDTDVEVLQAQCDRFGVQYDAAWPAGKLVMELCSDLVEPNLIQPTFLHDWPAEAQPLARRNPEDSRRVLAWDLIVNGTEIGCAFSELADPVVQREVLTAQSLRAANGDAEAMDLDESFLEAMEYGMAPCGGLGLGVDRMVMLFTGSNIREAVIFPMVRREDS